MKLSSKLGLGLLAIVGVIGVLGWMGAIVSGELDKIRVVELPMEQNLREVEVGLWQTIHAADAFHLTGSSEYLELYERGLVTVDSFIARYEEYVAGASEREAIDAFVDRWAEAKRVGDRLIGQTMLEVWFENELLRAIEATDALVDDAIKPSLRSSERRESLLEIEESIWQLMARVRKRERSAVVGDGSALTSDEFERRIAAIDARWREARRSDVTESLVVRFDATWTDTSSAARRLFTAHEKGEALFAALFRSIAATADVIDGRIQPAIQQRIDRRATTSALIRQLTPLAILLVVLIGAAIWLATIRSVVRGAGDCVEFAQRLAEGDGTARLGTTGTDEFGALAGALNRMACQLERNRAEAEKLAEQRLANEVREVELTTQWREATKLQRANEELADTQSQLLQSEKMAAVGQLAAGVAHEINNPVGFVLSNLNALKGYGKEILTVLSAYEARDQARRNAGHADADDGDEIAALAQKYDLAHVRTDLFDLIDESQDGMLRIKKIVADLKDFSRMDDGEWQMVDVHECLDSTLGVVASEIKYRAAVVKEYGATSRMRCRPSQLNQVLLNLFVNAAQAMAGMGTITIRTFNDAQTLSIVVADTGAGISPDVLPRIFNPFFTTKPIGQGTGLGLSISYGIVRKHGGTIEVASEVGVGTRFTVRLPLRGAAGNDVPGDADADVTLRSLAA